MRPKIIPAIPAHSADELLRKIRLVEPVAHDIQIDILDGSLIPNACWNNPEPLRRIKIKPAIELHLMVNNPEKYIRAWRKIKNFQRATWHVEAPIDHEKLIRWCRRHALKIGLAISPETPVARLVPFLRKIDAALIMGVKTGWSGQKLLRPMLTKADELHTLAPRLTLEWDGGITSGNMRLLARHGITRLNVTSLIFKQRDPARTIKQLQIKLVRQP